MPIPDQDILGRRALSYGGSFTADGATVTFGGASPEDPAASLEAGIGLLTQQLMFNYQQPVTRIYEIGSNRVFFIAGRAQGNASMARILGPRPLLLAFYRSYGSVCNAGQNILEFSAVTACDASINPGSMRMLMDGVVLTSVADSVRAEDMVISEQLALMFVALLVNSFEGF